MLVNLKRRWFDPSGNRNDPDDNPHQFPEEWKELLPSTAQVVADSGSKADKAAGKADGEEPKQPPAVVQGTETPTEDALTMNDVRREVPSQVQEDKPTVGEQRPNEPAEATASGVKAVSNPPEPKPKPKI